MRVWGSNVSLLSGVPATHLVGELRRVARIFRLRFRRRLPGQVGRNLRVALVRILDGETLLFLLLFPMPDSRRRPRFRRLTRGSARHRRVVVHRYDVVTLLGVTGRVALALLVNKVLKFNDGFFSWS